MSESMTTADARSPSPRQVALGLFILFQLAFLVVSNLLGFMRWGAAESTERQKQLINRLAPDFAEQRGYGWRWSEELDGDLRHWMELTGQEQDWSLFAPGVGKGTGFPAVLMLWDDPPTDGPSLDAAMLAFDETNGFSLCALWNPASPQLSLPAAAQLGVLGASSPWELLNLHAVLQFRAAAPALRADFLLADNEPKDIGNFVRFGKPRFRRYEGRFYVNTLPEEKETLKDYAARMTEMMQTLVGNEEQTIAAYLKYRTQGWLRGHPGERAPKRVVLLERFYRIRTPEEPRGWEGPMLVPCTVWRPDTPRDDRYYGVEPYDFTAQRFKRLAR